MRSLLLASLILLTSTVRAAETRDGGMDDGGKLALIGGIVFSATYQWTATGTAIDNGFGCGIQGHPGGCRDNAELYIPVAGGFLDGTPGGVVSSLFQVGGLVVMGIGLATHKWRVPVDGWTKVRF
jgi:hypothetical protein